MRTRLAAFAVGVALAACVIAPGATAFASPSHSKAVTTFAGLKYSYSIPATHAVDSGATISGKLLYRKWVRRAGKRRSVYVAQDGIVRLYRYNPATDRAEAVGRTWTRHGGFSFTVTRGGEYLVYYRGNSNRRPAMRPCQVREDTLTLTNFRATRASEDASGGIFVTLSADLGAPAGVLTSATPGVFMLGSLRLPVDADGSPVGPVGMGSIFRIIYNVYYQAVPASGTYRLGFTVPDEMRETTITAVAEFTAGEDYVTKSGTTQFKPSDLLP